MPSPELGVVAMKRREFITLVGGAAAAWPLAANAPVEGKAPPYRRMNPGSTDIPGAVGFYEGLLELGYTEGLNIAIERRYGDWNTDPFLQVASLRRNYFRTEPKRHSASAITRLMQQQTDKVFDLC